MEIIVQNVFKKIKNNQILNDLSLNINPGEIYGLIGPNGSGKTTFIRCLLGLYEIDSGIISIDGVQTTEKDFIKMKNKIGCVMDHLGIYKDLSAWDNLEFFHRIYFPKSNKDSRKIEIENLLEKFGILHKKDERTTFFSKGQIQRLALARALISKPELLVLDEPTTGLDVEGIITFREYILKAKTKKVTVFINSHNLNELQRICDKCGFIKNGKIIEETCTKSLEKPNYRDEFYIESIYKKIFDIKENIK